MIKNLSLRLLPLLAVLFTAGLVESCKKTNDVTSTQVELLSFGPTGARHGDTLSFIGLNLTKVNSIEFTGATVEKSAFIEQNGEMIRVKVPAATQKGYVTLKTTDGDIRTKTQLNLKVASRITGLPVIARPGENITLTGDYLNWVKTITFGRDKLVTSFVSQTLTSIVVKVPDDAQTGPLLLSYGGTDSMQVETPDTLRVALPVATALAPSPVTHASNLTVTGTNLDLTKQILFTGVTAPVTTFVSQSATQIVVKVPGSTNNGKITLVAASGVKTESAAAVQVLLPAITSISPSPVDPLANVTITGTNLNLVASVSFNNAAPVTTFVSQSATQLVVRVPTGVTSGKVILNVLNSTLTVASPGPLDITGDVPPPTIALPFYKDALSGNWNGWLGGGWGGTKDMNNTNPVREGTKSIKIDYVGGYGSPLQLGGANVDVTPYTTFKVSIYGAPGSGGKRINIGINGADAYNITVVEGKWTDYAVPISSLTSSNKITEVLIKEYNGSGGFTIYVDALGLN